MKAARQAWMDPRHRAVRYRLGLEEAESLVQIAGALVDQGHLMPAAIELLVLEKPDLAAAGPLFEKMCVEFGLALPTRDEAIDELIKFHLEQMVNGTCGLLDGMKRIMEEVYWPHVSTEPVTQYVGDSRGIHLLLGAYWGYDDLIGSIEADWEGKRGKAGIRAWEASVLQYAGEWLRSYAQHGIGKRKS